MQVPESSRSRYVVNRLVVALLLSGIFMEWLIPLLELTDRNEILIVKWFMGLSVGLLLTGCFNLSFGLNVILPLGYVAIVMMGLYGDGLEPSWFMEYVTIAWQDTVSVFNTGGWHDVSMESRALILIIGWSLLLLSIQKVVLGKNSILLFMILTIVYLITLQGYMEVNIVGSLYRAVAEGLLLQAWLFIYQAAHDDSPVNMQLPRLQEVKGWLLGGIITVICIVAGAVWLSQSIKAKESTSYPWQETIQAIQAWGESQGESRKSSSTTGYSLQDTALGAPLTLRYDPYFMAISPLPTYWRGESKDYYNGHGWQSMTTSVLATNLQEQSELGTNTDSSAGRGTVRAGTSSSQVKQRVIFLNSVDREQVLFTGGIPLAIPTLFSTKQGNETVGIPIRYDAIGQSLVTSQTNSIAKPFQSYEITAAPQPMVSDALRQSKGDDPTWVTHHYLQLPASLPARVTALGHKLTSSTTNRYDAVLAIKQYLEQNYRYELNTKAPSAKQDFVDQFLFEQKIGYCDHFSTSMVVLLRSGGIPARWVKGFAPGSLVTNTVEEGQAGNVGQAEQAKSGEDRYLVTYADAHSWVEVYFPDVGWVLFDPTPGYDGKTSTISSPQGMSQGNAEANHWWTTIKMWWSKGTEQIGDTIKQIQYTYKEIQGYLLSQPILITVIIVMPIVIWLTMLMIKQYGTILLIGMSVWLQHKTFPNRDVLLTTSNWVWNQLYRLYGTKLATTTPREYIEQIITDQPEIDAASRQRLLYFINLWEEMYYGAVTPSRKETRGYLLQCWRLVLPRKNTG